jgi:glycosyltransferase involved in cell wall biosynthesis
VTTPDTNTTSKDQVLNGRDMLCFSHDWNADPLSKTHLMRLLSRNNRVLWVNSIGYRAPTASRRDLSRAIGKVLAATTPLKQVEPNLHVLSPLIIPAYGRPWVSRFNRWFLRQQIKHAMRSLDFDRPINWVFNPAASMVAGSLGEDMLIYYCVDDYSAFSGVHSAALAQMEHDLLKRSDLVITSSDRLFNARREHNPSTTLVRHGVDWTHFRRTFDTSTSVPNDLAAIRGPILGYFGLIADDWVDVPLIAHVAQRLPQASIVMLGKTTMDVSALKRLPNVHMLGHRPYESLPAYCKGFDVAMIPFPVNQATLNSNPLKAREYLAAGLPVVSTSIPEVEALGLCRTAKTSEDFVKNIIEALENPGPAIARSELVRAQNWEARLSEIESHVARAAQRKIECHPASSTVGLQAA